MRTVDARAVLAVAMTGNLTRAASHLGVTPPSLSASVRRVERELDVTLFERSNRGMRLSDAGRKLIPALSSVSDAEQALRRAVEAGDAMGSQPEELTIGTVFGYGTLLVQQAAENVRQAGVDLQVQIAAFGLDDPSAGIRDGAVDAAVIPGPSALDEQTESALLWEEHRVLLIQSGHELADRPALSLAEIAHLPWLRNPDIDEVWDAFWRLNDVRGGPPQLLDRVCLTPIDVIVALQSGDGVMCTLESLREVFTLEGVSIIPLSDVPPSPVFLRWLPSRTSTALASLAGEIQQLAALDAG